MKYAPVPLDEKCTQFLTAGKGWIQGVPDLGQLPIGEQKFADVRYVIRDFKTSPLPSCIMLAGPGVKGPMPSAVEGIPVGRKADALFFLHTLPPTRSGKPVGDPKTAVAAAGAVQVRRPLRRRQEAEVPVFMAVEWGRWRGEAERPAEAAVAWAAPLPKEAGKQTVVYQMSWTNPRPGEEIRSIDVRYDDKVGSAYGIPVVLAITAGMTDK